jgi:hypothetical protein
MPVDTGASRVFAENGPTRLEKDTATVFVPAAWQSANPAAETGTSRMSWKVEF